MTLDHLWAGWRAAYVTSASEAATAEHEQAAGDGTTACIFCRILSSDLSQDERMVVAEGQHVAVLMNAYPYSPGHMMAMPLRHVRELEELTDSEEIELWRSVRRAAAALKRAYRPDGCNIGLNLGRAAGAGIPDHLHVHVVPRWLGDTNFMTSTAATRVLPEPLDDSYAKVKAAWQ